MSVRFKLRPKRFKKKSKQQLVSIKIEKQPIPEEERKEKLREDRLKIAQRYEELLLYDEAIKYYKKLGMKDDVIRIKNIKKEIYLKKARDFEAVKKYEDALRLYENLKMTEDVERINKLLENGDHTADSSVSEIEPTGEVTGPSQESTNSTEEEYPITKDEVDQIEPEVPGTQDAYEASEVQEVQEVQDTTRQEVITKQPRSSKKVFKICPYCGEELNLPKKPNFCPYCKESFM